jgi:hypothetical protein
MEATGELCSWISHSVIHLSRKIVIQTKKKRNKTKETKETKEAKKRAKEELVGQTDADIVTQDVTMDRDEARL